jgi:hypothetical protein
MFVVVISECLVALPLGKFHPFGGCYTTISFPFPSSQTHREWFSMNRSTDVCFGRGEPLPHGLCDCDDGYGEPDCRGDFSTHALLRQLWICLGILIAMSAAILIITAMRAYRVVMGKFRVNRDRTLPMETHHRTCACCHWMDTQMACLLTLLASGLCTMISLCVGRTKYAVLSQQVWYGGVVLQEVAAVFFVRFFASIVAKYHRPTYQLIRILDYITFVWTLLALSFVVAMPLTDIRETGPVTTPLVGLISLLMIFLLSSTQIYTVTVLNTAIKGPVLLRRAIVITSSDASPTSPHGAHHQHSPVGNGPVSMMPAPLITPTARAAMYSSHSLSPHGSKAHLSSLPSPSHVVLSPVDRRRIQTLSSVRQAVRGMQLIGTLSLAAFVLSATVFDNTSTTSLYLNNCIGWYDTLIDTFFISFIFLISVGHLMHWYRLCLVVFRLCPMIAGILMVVGMGRPGRTSPAPSAAHDVAIAANHNTGHVTGIESQILATAVGGGGGVGTHAAVAPVIAATPVSVGAIAPHQSMISFANNYGDGEATVAVHAWTAPQLSPNNNDTNNNNPTPTMLNTNGLGRSTAPVSKSLHVETIV